MRVGGVIHPHKKRNKQDKKEDIKMYEYKEITQSKALFTAHTRLNKLKRAHIINLETGKTKKADIDKIESYLNRNDIKYMTDDFGLNDIFMLDMESKEHFLRCIFVRAKIS